MKILKIFFISTILLTICLKNFSQENVNTTTPANDPIIYTFFVNIVPDQVNFPLIGFVNVAKGSHKGFQLSFFNLNAKDFRGSQISFINNVGGSFNGMQLGFINTTLGNVNGAQISFVNTSKFMKGFQLGFVNTTIGQTDGAQISFVNTTTESVNGLQLGFVNTSLGEVLGPQVGFVNFSKKAMNGFQLGFVNVSNPSIQGSQIGFVNITKSLRGFQLGFLNYVDTIENGFPLGFLSIVRKGGYQAIELSLTEMNPINLSFKIGVQKFYTTINAGFNPDINNHFTLGAGFGSILYISNSFFFNPEIISQNTIESNNSQVLSFVANFGYSINPHFHIILGPSISWGYNSNNSVNYRHPVKPFFSFYDDLIDNNNRLTIGGRLALRYSFSKQSR